MDFDDLLRSALLAGIGADRFWTLTPVEVFLEIRAKVKLQKVEQTDRDIQMADLMTLIANCHRNPDVKRTPFKRSDFLPERTQVKEEKWKPTPKQPWEIMWAKTLEMHARITGESIGGE